MKRRDRLKAVTAGMANGAESERTVQDTPSVEPSIDGRNIKGSEGPAQDQPTPDSQRPRDNHHLPHGSIFRSTRSDPIAFWTALSSVAACAAALFAGWAALETQQSAAEANKATKAAVWLQLLNEYHAPEMLAAMRELREWQQRNPTDFTQTFEKLLLKPDKSAAERQLVDSLDSDRRRVSGFFSSIQTLCEGNVIDEHFANRTFGGATYRFLIDVLVPMENAKTDAMLKTRAMSPEDKLVADRRQADVIAFYARVFH